MEYIIHRVCGHSTEQAVTLRPCTPEEAPTVFALQNEVHALMPHPDWFVPSTLEEVEQDLCIGAWQGERLGAYFTMKFCGANAHNYASFMGVPEAEWPHWANADSAIVHPDWRGNGLQRVLMAAAEQYMPPQITAIGVTVNPENKFSLKATPHNSRPAGLMHVLPYISHHPFCQSARKYTKYLSALLASRLVQANRQSAHQNYAVLP